MSLAFVVQIYSFGLRYAQRYIVDDGLQFGHAGESATTNAFVCDVSKEPLD